MYGDEPDRWDDGLEGYDRLRVIINAMTRLRVLRPDGAMALKFKGEPGEAATGLTPWFDAPRRASRDHAIVCGHWSALGLQVRPDLLSIDSGCVWGRALTAVRLEDRGDVGAVPARRREAQQRSDRVLRGGGDLAAHAPRRSRSGGAKASARDTPSAGSPAQRLHEGDLPTYASARQRLPSACS
jgi:hypothetical protein